MALRASDYESKLDEPLPECHGWLATHPSGSSKRSDRGRNEGRLAVEEYHAWQAMADEALRSGVHPAIAYAIGRTGKVMPENVEMTPDGIHAIASGEDAEWIEAFNEYAEKHPETVEGEFLRGRDPRRERLH